ncbi:hypothetical protein [Paraliomyxa miuraensis]|uniref:hypothetical protein n=1 Tax=Paraliomyxa miuraensis TaxID=376150 RepID=UPI00225B399E|nr:hypothetical protein [Paraliomyxa miuraensis]MCX4241474.1 hypothetical protein [Paraliomyxa miuraensis]
MNRLLQALGLLATVVLVGYAVVLSLSNPDADEVVEDVIADAQADEGHREELERNREILRRTARGLAMTPGAQVEHVEQASRAEPVPSAPYGSGQIDEATAREGFDYAMDRVDGIIESRRRLEQDEWQQLYRETNDAFAALSMMLDATNEAQAAELETAHGRLKKGLGKVRVRGRKLPN